tara:strand:- start:544 stop:807 length:264 start_codon:yes stop_codon:yes gene_type:complete
MKKIIYLMLLISVFGLLVGCVPVEKKCSADTDCVKKTCCHASEAVNKKYGPNCKNKLCTMSCEPGTIDCGQGKIKCVSGACRAVLKK